MNCRESGIQPFGSAIAPCPHCDFELADFQHPALCRMNLPPDQTNQRAIETAPLEVKHCGGAMRSWTG